jgi:hypothetical protein
MNINNLYGSIATTPTTNVGAVNQTGGRKSSIPPAMGGAANATISTPGQFLGEMQDLSQQNPAEFKTVAAQVAASFQRAASQASGPQAQFLTSLANRFDQASQTGSLQPPQGAQAAQTGQAAQGVSGAGASQAGGGSAVHHHRHGGGSEMTESAAVQQAFQSAMNILSQTMQGASTSTPSTSTT